MMNRNCIFFSIFFLFSASWCKYTPDWDSLDHRPLPSWYDEAKFGIFIHWGLFSVPAYGCNNGGAAGEWYWWNLRGAKEPCLVEWHEKTWGPDFEYEDFAPMFHTSMFTPDEWAQIFKDAGAKYVVLTSKHHDGFCNWPSAESWNWNSVDAGPHRDLVNDITQSVRKAGLRMGLYHSLFEWFNPLYLQDKANNATTTFYVNTTLHPQLHDIIHRYQPDVLWSDGDWEQKDTYWGSKEFLAWLYNESPVKNEVVVNDRWGSGCTCHHGGYYTCNDRYNPGKLLKHKWENCLTIDKGSWGFRQNANLSNYMTIEELVYELVSTVSCGGNMLLNVGPTSEGKINAIFADRLHRMGEWLKINGEAIYATKPWRVQNDTSTVWYTSKNDAVYAVSLSWPDNFRLRLLSPIASTRSQVEMLGYGPVKFDILSGKGIEIVLPTIPISKLPSTTAWAFKLTNVNQ